MKRLLYVADHVGEIESLTEALRRIGIGDWHVYRVGKDDVDSSPELSLRRRAETQGSTVGALTGFVLGLLASIAVVVVWHLSPMPALAVFAALSLVPTLLGYRLGARIGGALARCRLARLRDAMAPAQAMLIVDVEPQQLAAVAQLADTFSLHPSTLHPLSLRGRLRCT